MNAPDKIYIADNVFPTHIDWDGSPINTKRIESSDIEYIRKDALLKWLQKEYKTNKWFYDTHAKPNNLHTGRCEAYKQVIDKIESL